MTKRLRPLSSVGLSSNLPNLSLPPDVLHLQLSFRPSSFTQADGKRKAAVIEIDQSDDEGPSVTQTRIKKNEVESDLWVEVHGPLSVSDLAVHKKKVGEVRSWLKEALGEVDHPETSAQAALRGKYRRILALSGSAGVGKTATVRAIADEMGVKIVEWVEGSEEYGMSGVTDSESLTNRFTSFLARHAYPSLSFASAPSSSRPKKLLLLDDLPNLSHSPTRAAFQQALLEFVGGWTGTGAPLVVVLSETGDSGRAGESWKERRGEGDWDLRGLLGREVLDGPSTRVIDFNPIAPTLLLKALNRVLSLALPLKTTQPPSEAVELIVHSSNGDIRSAINALQFLCKIDLESGRKVSKKRKGRGGKPPKEVDKGLKELLNSVTRREQSLALFHALGKVLYNKRVGDPQEEEDEDDPAVESKALIALPTHLKGKERRVSRVDNEALFSQAPVDVSLLNLYLHQNYPLFTTDIDECLDLVDSISASDSLRSDDDMWQTSKVSISYAFEMTTRGMLMGLPSPVPRRGQKVYKPDWFEAAKVQKVNESGLADVGRWASELGLGTGGGQTSQTALACELIPHYKHLPIPPSYPRNIASLPGLATLAFVRPTDTRSALNLRSILDPTRSVGTEDPGLMDQLEVEPEEGEGSTRLGMGSTIWVEQPRVEDRLEGGLVEESEEDEIEEF